MKPNSFYYDLVIDETGSFLGDNNSYIVGYLIESNDKFLLSKRQSVDENGNVKVIKSSELVSKNYRNVNERVEVILNNKLLDNGYKVWYECAKSKINKANSKFVGISDFDHLGDMRISFRDRMPIQKELLEKYKNILDIVTCKKWKLCAFRQPRSCLNNPALGGEGATINYLETWSNGLLALLLEERFEKCTENVFFNVGIATRQYAKFTDNIGNESISVSEYKNRLLERVNDNVENPVLERIIRWINVVFEQMERESLVVYTNEYIDVLKEYIGINESESIAKEFAILVDKVNEEFRRENNAKEIKEYIISFNKSTENVLAKELREQLEKSAQNIYSEIEKDGFKSDLKTYRDKLKGVIVREVRFDIEGILSLIDSNICQPKIAATKIITPNQYRKAFQDCVTKKLGIRAGAKWRNKVNFYTINSMHDEKNDEKNKVYEKYYKGTDVTRGEGKKVTLQFMLTIADCFANSYLHKDVFNEFFENMGNMFEYDDTDEFILRKHWDLEDDIFAHDDSKLLNAINKLILFPTLVNSTDFTEAYSSHQKRYNNLLDNLLISKIIEMDPISRKTVFNKIQLTLKEEIRNIKLEDADKLTIKIETMLNLYEKLVNCCLVDEPDIHRFGVDLYLFLANRYQNSGNSSRVKDLLDKAQILKRYWSLEQHLVNGLLKMNGLNDKYDFDGVKREYDDTLKALNKKSFGPFCSANNDEAKALRGKINSIFIESRIPDAGKDWGLCQKAYLMGLNCFDMWEDKQHLMFQYIRAALAAAQIRIAKRVFLSSLKKEYDGVPQQGNFTIFDFLSKRNASIAESDFYTHNSGRFRAYVYLNYLTLLREMLKTNDCDVSILTDIFFNSEKINEILIQMQGYPYPRCVIYWRIAQVFRCLNENFEVRTGFIESSREYYLKSIETLSNTTVDSEPRLIAMLISIYADYLSFLIQYRLLATDRGVQGRLTALYKKYCVYCRNNPNQKQRLFDEAFKEWDEEIVKLDVLEKISKASNDYY